MWRHWQCSHNYSSSTPKYHIVFWPYTAALPFLSLRGRYSDIRLTSFGLRDKTNQKLTKRENTTSPLFVPLIPMTLSRAEGSFSYQNIHYRSWSLVQRWTFTSWKQHTNRLYKDRLKYQTYIGLYNKNLILALPFLADMMEVMTLFSLFSFLEEVLPLMWLSYLK